jgi:peptide subunit release factor RF-3
LFVIQGVAQSIRSQDETAKKHLASTYIQVIELLLNVSTKKTEVTSELRQELTVQNFDTIIEKFTSIDTLCHSVLEHCPKPSSRNAVTDIVQTLQEAVEEIRLTSSTLSLTSQAKK